MQERSIGKGTFGKKACDFNYEIYTFTKGVLLILREDDDAVPDVPAAVQDLLLNLFTSVYNHQDEEGR